MRPQKLFRNFYKDRKVFITGHTGFKGCWLALWLTAMGAKVAGYSLQPPSDPNLFEAVQLQKRLAAHYTADIRDFDRLKHALQTEAPEIIFHLAAQTLVQHSYTDPLETYATNVLGTANVLEAIRRVPGTVRVCQVITSDKCYQNLENGHRYCETDPLGGSDPYSASKAAAELVAASYRKSYFPPEEFHEHGVSISTVRAGNVIGGGDWGSDRILPDSIRALGEGKPIPVRNPRAVRPWQYVLDAVAGYLLLAERQASGDMQFANAWNFGPVETASVTVAQLVEKILAEWGKGSWISQVNRKASGQPAFAEARLLQLDSSKAQKLLCWHPVYSFDTTLKETVQWYRHFADKKTDDRWDFTIQHLESYTQAAAEQEQTWTQLNPKILK